MKYRVMFTYDEVVEADDVREALIEANLDDLSDVIEFDFMSSGLHHT